MQESQLLLESEFNAFKKSQSTEPKEAQRYTARPSNANYSQSPRKRYETEEDHIPVGKTAEDNYAEASPFSPARDNNPGHNYLLTKTISSRPQTEEDVWIIRDDNRARRFICQDSQNSPRRDYLQKSEDELSNQEWRTPSEQRLRNSSAMDGNIPIGYSKDFQEKDDNSQIRNPSINKKYQKYRDPYESQEAAILQSKQKIKEDLDKYCILKTIASNLNSIYFQPEEIGEER